MTKNKYRIVDINKGLMEDDTYIYAETPLEAVRHYAIGYIKDPKSIVRDYEGKGRLPPAYGKKSYKDMTAEEKEVIDGFQGEQAYNEVMAKSNYYLAPVVNKQMLMLES